MTVCSGLFSRRAVWNVDTRIFRVVIRAMPLRMSGAGSVWGLYPRLSQWVFRVINCWWACHSPRGSVCTWFSNCMGSNRETEHVLDGQTLLHLLQHPSCRTKEMVSKSHQHDLLFLMVAVDFCELVDTKFWRLDGERSSSNPQKSRPITFSCKWGSSSAMYVKVVLLHGLVWHPAEADDQSWIKWRRGGRHSFAWLNDKKIFRDRLDNKAECGFYILISILAITLEHLFENRCIMSLNGNKHEQVDRVETGKGHGRERWNAL